MAEYGIVSIFLKDGSKIALPKEEYDKNGKRVLISVVTDDLFTFVNDTTGRGYTIPNDNILYISTKK